MGQTSETRRPVLDREFVADYPVDRLTPHPRNARVHHRESKKASLELNTQYAPLLVQRSTGFIIAGNGTFKVATEELGWTEMDVILLGVDDEAAGRIALADNATGDKSGYDNAALVAWLSVYADSAESLLGTGYDLADYESLVDELAAAAPDAVAALTSPPEFDDEPGAALSAGGHPVDDEPAPEAEAEDEPEDEPVVLEFCDDDERREFADLIGRLNTRMGLVYTPAEAAVRALRVFTTALDQLDAAGELPQAVALEAVVSAAERR